MIHGADSATVLGCTLIGGRRQIDAGEAVWLEQLGEFHVRGDWSLDGARDTVHWLRSQCRMAHATAKEKLRVALALRQRTVLAAAFAAGRLTYCQVRALTRMKRYDDETDAVLVESARSCTVADLERLVRHANALEEQDREPDGEQASWEKVGLRVIRQHDGLDTIEITCLPEDTARMLAVVDAVLDRRFFAAQRGADSRESTNGSHDPAAPRPVAARRLDALLEIVEAGAVGLADEGHLDPDRATLNVIIDYDALIRDGNGGAETIHGAPIRGDAARRLACDAGYQRLIVKGRSLVLDVGTRTRKWNAAQRRAIRYRHGHRCAIGGCGGRITQIHHITPVVAGGATDIAAGVPLCAYHHRLVHEGGWEVAYFLPAGVTTLTGPSGQRIDTAPYPRPGDILANGRAKGDDRPF